MKAPEVFRLNHCVSLRSIPSAGILPHDVPHPFRGEAFHQSAHNTIRQRDVATFYPELRRAVAPFLFRWRRALAPEVFRFDHRVSAPKPHNHKTVIPTEAARRFFLALVPRVRRAAQWRDLLFLLLGFLRQGTASAVP